MEIVTYLYDSIIFPGNQLIVKDIRARLRVLGLVFAGPMEELHCQGFSTKGYRPLGGWKFARYKNMEVTFSVALIFSSSRKQVVIYARQEKCPVKKHWEPLHYDY